MVLLNFNKFSNSLNRAHALLIRSQNKCRKTLLSISHNNIYEKWMGENWKINFWRQVLQFNIRENLCKFRLYQLARITLLNALVSRILFFSLSQVLNSLHKYLLTFSLLMFIFLCVFYNMPFMLALNSAVT